MQVAYTPAEIAAIVGAQRTAGSTTDPIRDIASLTAARAGDLSFLGNAKYRAQVGASTATALLLPLDYTGEPRPGQVFLFVENPSVALAKVCARIEAALWPKPAPGVHRSAVVASTARVDATAHVGPLCVVEDDAVVGPGSVLQASVFVGRGARVGEGCYLMPGVVLGASCSLGQRVRLQPGVVIGSDGFGYEFVNGRHEKIPQIGVVVIGDDVEIGANSTLDRARFSRTVVGEGTKIDNMVQIAHNVIIGKHCILCAQVGISGSTTLEDYVILGGQAGVGGHITLGQGTKAGGQTGIAYDTPPGSYLNGTPAIPYLLERRLQVLHQRLPDLFKRVEALEKK
ncbi:UDP-3-O-(3-hydroxymyristoyl)glucosamine N-acyltransferase [Opitutus sp. GAS368]|jgi:UDP-3-O-[3-hydroxymyristoyl] glucosamine N-acyltransferase|uniref:UDP-3-O-(3-hydroxymyristoyl)glucosamine N-acyltransferase n=1 Tax=Opitutus sp. GAS368 TaxID=1882749 RepID=UPI00087CFF6F|nr:UDP-3-O-(3-hydroxymyristoyl)glucosamine N-acyltransferase [Opitutus sp. GAS368]SDS31229.1 UDP-3-O-[3-hydroxymyristoyl] glucosamine N-acyltransferase [Opitutus sp. GAS368]